MRHTSSFTATLLVVILVILQAFEPLLSAQTAPLTPQQLDQLLSPIALYPDPLLSQIMTASTSPQQVLDVDNWLAANPNLSGAALSDAAQQQGFDPAFIALVNFPQVLDMMAQHIDDYAAIGNAFSADQASVTASIQRLRAQAYAAGSLTSNAQQTVTVQQVSGQTIYVIQPANPQIVYVPQYDPTVVYFAPSTGAVVAASLISFGVGIGIGALIATPQPWGWGGWGWNWGGGRAYYNHAYWGGWANPYRPPNVWFRPRPIVWSARPGYGGNWHYRPPAYRPPTPGVRPGYGRPPYGPSNPPGSRPGVRPPQPTTPPGAGRPNATPPNRPQPGTTPIPPANRRTPAPGVMRPTNPPPNQPNQPTRAGNPGRPGTSPGTPRPSTPPSAQPARPANPQRPLPSRPTEQPQSRPQQQPQPRPQPQPQPNRSPQPSRPAPQARPAPAPRPAPQQAKPAPRPKPSA